MYEIKIIDSRYPGPMQDEINKLGKSGWELFSFDVKQTPQGLIYVACMRLKRDEKREKE